MKRRNKNRENRRTRKKGGFWKTFGIIVASALTACLLMSAVSFGGGLFEKERNEANLLDPENYLIKSEATGQGFDIDVRDDGSIKVTGTSTSSGSRPVSSVTLPAGTYTLSGVKEPDKLKYTLYVEILGQQYHANTGNATFTLDSEQTVNVIFQWGEDYKVPFANRVIYPCLVEGQTAGEFYAK